MTREAGQPSLPKAIWQSIVADRRVAAGVAILIRFDGTSLGPTST